MAKLWMCMGLAAAPPEPHLGAACCAAVHHVTTCGAMSSSICLHLCVQALDCYPGLHNLLHT